MNSNQTPNSTAQAAVPAPETRNDGTSAPPQYNEEVISDRLTPPKRVIAVAVDDSEAAKFALQWTLEHLVNPAGNDQVCLLNCRPHAVTDYIIGHPGLAGDIAPEPSFEYNEECVSALEQANREASHNLLKTYGEHVLKKSTALRAIALRGDPRKEILAKASFAIRFDLVFDAFLQVEELRPDMLVTGSRGLGILQKVFRGSLSDYLVQHSPVPVIVPRKHS
ncbi:hypothetical protein CcCBS67573_g00795 [Chytriomyces confervae]|uniref:UspA domain-containing protein n=1 Tax=Chytriomyces confervae TaxID=246404 RepID=A0A507FNB0_9FUNG|nr:hypothetical protein CcCBS67573_g00795 [Chytriomyces confervae]